MGTPISSFWKSRRQGYSSRGRKEKGESVRALLPERRVGGKSSAHRIQRGPSTRSLPPYEEGRGGGTAAGHIHAMEEGEGGRAHLYLLRRWRSDKGRLTNAFDSYSEVKEKKKEKRRRGSSHIITEKPAAGENKLVESVAKAKGVIRKSTSPHLSPEKS